MKSVDIEEKYPQKTTEDAFEDYAVEFKFLKNKVLPGKSERGSGVVRRRIEEYLEKKRLRDLLQEEVVDDVFQ